LWGSVVLWTRSWLAREARDEATAPALGAGTDTVAWPVPLVVPVWVVVASVTLTVRQEEGLVAGIGDEAGR